MKVAFYQFSIAHKYQRLVRCMFVCFFVFASASAQQALFTNQQHFGVDDGLPQSYISGITQDKDGFIWIATLDGLARYDGRKFRTFRYNPGDTTGLAANAIYYMYPQTSNELSLSYDGLLSDEFDMQSFRIKHNSSRGQVRELAGEIWKVSYSQYAYNGREWIFVRPGNKGIGVLNVATGKTKYFEKRTGALQSDSLGALVLSDEGKLYLLSPSGIHVSDTTRNKFQFIPFPALKKLQVQTDPGRKKFGSLAVLPGNRLAFYDLASVYIFDLTTQTIKEFPIPGANKLLPLYARSIKTDAKGQAYFENEGRIFRIGHNGEIKLLWQNKENPSLHISAYFIDRSEVLWVSVNAQGLTKVDLQALPFQTFTYKVNFISDIMEQAGANREAFPAHWSLLEMSYFFRQARDNKGNVYVCYNYGNRNEVFVLNATGFKSFRHVPGKSLYTAIVVTNNGEVRVYDQLSASWFCWKSPDAVPTILQFDKNSMVDMNLADARIVGGSLWLSTYTQGLLQYRDTQRINHFFGSLPKGKMPKDLTEICPDPSDSNRFWIGSRGGGLILWNAKTGLERVYTTNDGLPNNTIYCILPGRKGSIWCSSNKGIFRFDPAAHEVNSFEKTDGLQGNEFNRAHKFLFPDGRLAFGGMDGYTIFNPADFEIKDTAAEVPIMLTALQVNNLSQGRGYATSFIDQAVSTITSLEFPYDKNYLRFEFAALLFNQPQKIKYRYKLEGADKEWIENGTNNVAAYAAIEPGKYVLHINATDQNGRWSNTVKKIDISILSPLWATWWARTIYVLLAAVAIMGYIGFREKRVQTEQNLVFEKREAMRLRELDEAKNRFFSNITHEFRTPLTLILTPLEKLLQDSSLPPAAIRTLKTAQKSSRQLLRLINEFLDFSKINDGQVTVKLSAGDLALFVEELVNSFELDAAEKNIKLSLQTTFAKGFYQYDAEKWEKIITNLLGNALKFTPPAGEVTVTLNVMEDARARLQVMDTGPGIPRELHERIFERFFQVADPSSRTSAGTGIGLSLVKELTMLMNGSIELDSQAGGPTTFSVYIPVESAALPISTEPLATVRPGIMEGNGAETHIPLLLIAEDNNELRSFLVETMSGPYRVIESMDGLTAWEHILQELPEVVISDVMMPGQDGNDLCRMCKSDPRTAHIGFILLTSRAAHEARMQGLESGADDYITKPFHLDELLLRTANLVQLQANTRAHLRAQVLPRTPAPTMPVVTDPFLQKLYGELELKLDDPGLGVELLCTHMGMSRSTLNRKLKSLLDSSANDLIRTFRLQKATRLLSDGMDISSVAYKVGFSSPSYFTLCFREHYSITPSEYVAQKI